MVIINLYITALFWPFKDEKYSIHAVVVGTKVFEGPTSVVPEANYIRNTCHLFHKSCLSHNHCRNCRPFSINLYFCNNVTDITVMSITII